MATKTEMVAYIRRQRKLLRDSYLDQLHIYVRIGAVLNKLRKKPIAAKHKYSDDGKLFNAKIQWGRFISDECHLHHYMAEDAMKVAERWPTVKDLPKEIRCLKDAIAELASPRTRMRRWRALIPDITKANGTMAKLADIADGNPRLFKRIMADIDWKHKMVSALL